MTNMGLSKSKNAECLQRLCEIYFKVKIGFINLDTGCEPSVRLLPASYCLLYLLLLGSFLQKENKKDTATLSEANKKVVYKTRGFIN
jgi:hypothetical protein